MVLERNKAHKSIEMKVIQLIIFLSIGVNAIAQSIEKSLFELPDVIFKKIKNPIDYQSAYELKIKQAIDHEDPSKGHFYQRVFLSHKSVEQPTVIVTNGYSKSRNSITEVAHLLDANQLSVEHRYFGKSMPESMDYQYLTLEQATADLHHIRTIFSDLYSNHWISTGISKGGQTTLMYKYFYPEDVSVSIPYVAPLNRSLEDERIYTFLDTVGSDECRAKIKAVQLKLLKEREKVLPLMRWFSYGAQLNFNYLTFEEAFEYQILEYPFSFWQWGADCKAIPDTTEAIDSILYHLVTVSGLDFFADKSMKDFASHYYQAGSQMGYYGYDLKDLKLYIKALDNSNNPSAVFMPNKMEVEFNNEVMLKAEKWLQKDGNNIIYINGDADTWSATAVRPSKEVDALWFFMEGKDHGQARIRNMSAEEQKFLILQLEHWLDIDIEKDGL